MENNSLNISLWSVSNSGTTTFYAKLNYHGVTLSDTGIDKLFEKIKEVTLPAMGVKK